MWISSLKCVRKGGWFTIFFILHRLFIVFLIVLILHGYRYWKFLLLPGTLFLIEEVYRHFGKVIHFTIINEAIILSNKVLRISVDRPQFFKFKAGEYVFLKIPMISQFEYHPFTISSAPEQRQLLCFHIQSVGSWTTKLYNSMSLYQKTKFLKVPIIVNGPYGAPSDKIFNSKIVVLIAGGIGVTPFASVMKSMLSRIYGLLVMEDAMISPDFKTVRRKSSNYLPLLKSM